MNSIDLSNIAIVGSGPTALYILQRIWDRIDILKDKIDKITIFEKEDVLGMGMPYNYKTTDIYNLSNISSEEIPLLQQSFGDWLRMQSEQTLKRLNIKELPVVDTEVYSRIALGHYFHDQCVQLVTKIKSKHIQVFEQSGCEVIDISQKVKNELIITDSHNKEQAFSIVIIANGHSWEQEDKIEAGYYSSPWPIHKLLPKNNEVYNFTIGILGASLSAFDVVSSLSHRHGKFVTVDNKLKFIKNISVPNFRITLHSSKGWLPHLQYEQKEPIREIYRHFSRNQILELIGSNGLIRLEDYFDYLCRSILISAFIKDNLFDVAERLKNKSFSFKDFITLMSQKHEYVNSFEGMRSELVIAKKRAYRKVPIYWMETLDDLMYSLNYHAELLPAEDHLFLNKEVMSFLMNVVASLPLQSAEILLALYDANCLELKAGLVKFQKNSFINDTTKIVVQLEDDTSYEIEYKFFINCGGQQKINIDDYPFRSLVHNGLVKGATAKFANPNIIETNPEEWCSDEIVYDSAGPNFKLLGIDIDSSYRTINSENNSNNFLYDINFTHTNGLRPYSYGLQACNATSLILVESWIEHIVNGKDISKEIESVTELYEKNKAL